MNGLKLSVIAQVVGSIVGDNDLVSVRGDVEQAARVEFATGVGANQANLMFADRRTLAASASEELDLDGGSLLDPFGEAVTFKRVKAILVKAAADNTNKVVLGGAAANAFVGPFGAAAHTVSIDPGGAVLFVSPSAAGWVITASTADLLKIANGAGGSAVTYDIVLIGGAT